MTQRVRSRHVEQISACSELRRVREVHLTDWLNPLEQVELDRLRNELRRESWLFGRWVAKQLVCDVLRPNSCGLADIAITSRNDRGESVRPAVSVHGEIMPWSLSISHSERLVAAYLETNPHVTVGIDVTCRQTFGAGFLEIWFTANERRWAGEAEPDGPCLLWAAKEAVYKACNNGERFAPRKIEILPGSSLWWARCEGRELACEIETRIVGDDVIVIAKRTRTNE